jgi:hydroxymethylpyrimidine pyrophosphatase-like HAD family hydrolase
MNFSILGRGEGTGREEYVEWDKKTNERREISNRLKKRFPNLEVQIGGQTGLDLAPKGNNKAMILHDFSTLDNLYFFGDMMEPGQNDYPISQGIEIMGGTSYHVENWQQTYKILKGF